MGEIILLSVVGVIISVSPRFSEAIKQACFSRPFNDLCHFPHQILDGGFSSLTKV